jgi:predicted acyltransferase
LGLRAFVLFMVGVLFVVWLFDEMALAQAKPSRDIVDHHS